MSRKRSLAYLRRSAAKGRPYAQYRLGCELLYSIFHYADREEAVANLMTAYASGHLQAGRDLAMGRHLSSAFTSETAAHILFDFAARKMDTGAIVALWHMYAHHFDKATLKPVFMRYERYSGTISDALENERRDVAL